ncbi:MAG: glycoside hydrolase family 38 C-terminal domain-containing protein, partial [Planctomycetota bacterium]
KALMPTGYGDGGGATNEDMCERAQRLQSLAGMPKTKWGRIDEFFESMARVRANLPKWRGEIYMETHRGVQTTQSRLKETFRQAERALQTLEAAHAVAGLGEIDEQLWKRLVFVQFHDNIPGSSIPRVYRETIPELEAMTKQASKQASEALGGKGNTHLFNPLAMPMVASHKGKTVFLPALSAINIKEVDAIVDTVNAGKSSISNGRVKASFNTKGEISKLIIDGCKVEHREPLGQLFIFPDHPINFDAWDIDRDTLSLGTRCTTPTTVESGSDTTSAWTSFSRSIAQQSTITTRYEVRIGESVLRITYHLDWQDTQTLLKVAMPTRYQGENVRYGAPFGSTLRPQKQGTIAAEAMFEVPASRWAVVCDDTESQGLAMITESKFGFGCRDGLLHCSLNRSARHTQPHVAGTTTSLDLSEVPDEFTDIGEQVIRIALTSYEASTPREHQPAALAETLFAEPVLVKGTAINTPIINIEGLHSIIPTWVKPMSDGSMLLRVNETLGKRGSITIYLANGWEAIESDVMGEATRQEFSRGKLTVKMKPYQLKTVRIRT